jgi:hypothetical protein
VTKDPRLPIMAYVLDVLKLDAGVIKAKLYRSIREPTMVLDARKTLFLNGGNELPILDKSRGRIAEGCQAEDIHK